MHRWLAILAPGLLIAATGVGAGDLVTAGLAGNRLGLSIVWAVALGALLKWALNEGLARWQLATGTTLLEAWIDRLRIHWLFLPYLLIWSFCLGGALLSACGIAGLALVPLFDGGETDRRVWGIAHSLVAVVLVLAGGYRLFERVMAACIALMVVTVTVCAGWIATQLDPAALRLVSPLALRGPELAWTISLIGGVGGTVTLLSYGYWIREHGRAGAAGVRVCRLDLAVGYAMTALFGVGLMVIAAAAPRLEGGGARLLVVLGHLLGEQLGPAARWLFLIGAWAAVFSSVLGVWQGVPYLFADFVRHVAHRRAMERPGAAGAAGTAGAPPVDTDLTRTWAYRAYLLFLALPPMYLLWHEVAPVQLFYTVTGALFMPVLAVSLLILNNRTAWVGRELRSGWRINALLGAALAYFLWTAWPKLVELF